MNAGEYGYEYDGCANGVSDDGVHIILFSLVPDMLFIPINLCLPLILDTSRL